MKTVRSIHPCHFITCKDNMQPEQFPRSEIMSSIADAGNHCRQETLASIDGNTLPPAHENSTAPGTTLAMLILSPSGGCHTSTGSGTAESSTLSGRACLIPWPPRPLLKLALRAKSGPKLGSRPQLLFLGGKPARCPMPHSDRIAAKSATDPPPPQSPSLLLYTHHMPQTICHSCLARC